MQLPQLSTARLKLLPWQSNDLDALCQLWNEPAVRRFLFDDQPVSRELADEILGASLASAEQSGLGQWTIRPAADASVIIGFAGLRWTDQPMGACELLYGLLPAWWGQGLATEAAAAVIEDGFTRLKLGSIGASADAPNVSSFAVMQRLGMSEVRPPDAREGLIYFRIARA